MQDEELSLRLAVLAADAERAVQAAPAATIRARGQRRRLRLAGGVAVAVGLAALIGYPVATALDSPRPVTAWPDPTLIPDDLVLPHEHDSGWRRIDDVSTASAYNPCRVVDPGAPDATLPDRTDARTVTGVDQTRGFPADRAVQLFVYRTDAAAAEAMRALVRDSSRCGWNAGILLGHASEAERLYSTRPLRQPTTGTAGTFAYAQALRRGNVLCVTYGIVNDSMNDGSDSESVEAIGDLLCRDRGLCPAVPLPEASWLPLPPARTMPPSPRAS